MTSHERYAVSNRRSFDCLFSSLCGPSSKKPQNLRYWRIVRGIHRWSVNSPHRGPVTRKRFHLMTSWCVLVHVVLSISFSASKASLKDMGKWITCIRYVLITWPQRNKTQLNYVYTFVGYKVYFCDQSSSTLHEIGNFVEKESPKVLWKHRHHFNATQQNWHSVNISRKVNTICV